MVGIGPRAFPGTVDVVGFDSTTLQEQPELAPFGPPGRIRIEVAPVEQPTELRHPVAGNLDAPLGRCIHAWSVDELRAGDGLSRWHGIPWLVDTTTMDHQGEGQDSESEWPGYPAWIRHARRSLRCMSPRDSMDVMRALSFDRPKGHATPDFSPEESRGDGPVGTCLSSHLGTVAIVATGESHAVGGQGRGVIDRQAERPRLEGSGKIPPTLHLAPRGRRSPGADPAPVRRRDSTIPFKLRNRPGRNPTRLPDFSLLI